tara:strand:+ start:1485 stop:2063 length:579 start_codon:yes stop_codon:yes gene_type:complete
MSLQDFAALSDAQAYTEIKGRLISPDMMLSFITAFGYVDALITNPTTNESKAVQAAFQFGSEFNLMSGHPASITPTLDILIGAGLASEALKTALVAYANEVTYPHATATQADFARAKDLMDYTSAINQVSGFIKLTTSENCEAHRPKIFAVVQGIKTQVGTASEISLAGEYLARVPTNHASYIIENFYGVIT